MFRLTGLFLALLALPLKAATVNTLYHAQIPVMSEQENAVQLAHEQGLKEVLVKVSGDASVVENSHIIEALAQSPSFVSQFSFDQDDEKKTLNVAFDQKQIKQLLTEAKSRFWGYQRPNILVWIVDDNGTGRNILWDQSEHALVNSTKQAAEHRGLPITFPIGDFNDVTSVHVTDIWGSFMTPIANASMRYSVGGVLVVKVKQQADQPAIFNWQLYAQQPDTIASDSRPIRGEAQGDIAQASQAMMNSVTDHLAQQYAIVMGTEPAGEIEIEVDNIQSTEDFFNLERMLNQMTTVSRASALSIRDDNVVFRMDLAASLPTFEQEISYNSRISAMNYRYQGGDVPEKAQAVTGDTPTQSEFAHRYSWKTR